MGARGNRLRSSGIRGSRRQGGRCTPSEIADIHTQLLRAAERLTFWGDFSCAPPLAVYSPRVIQIQRTKVYWSELTGPTKPLHHACSQLALLLANCFPKSKP